MTLRYRFKDAPFEVAEEPFEAAGKKFNRGSFIIRERAAGRSSIDGGARELGIAGRGARRRAHGEDASGRAPPASR